MGRGVRAREMATRKWISRCYHYYNFECKCLMFNIFSHTKQFKHTAVNKTMGFLFLFFFDGWDFLTRLILSGRPTTQYYQTDDNMLPPPYGSMSLSDLSKLIRFQEVLRLISWSRQQSIPVAPLPCCMLWPTTKTKWLLVSTRGIWRTNWTCCVNKYLNWWLK